VRNLARTLGLVFGVGCSAIPAEDDAGVAVDAAVAPGPDAAVAPPTAAEALAELRRSVVALDSWRFRTDPDRVGEVEGWQGVVDDTMWPLLDAGSTWEEQGFADYDGVGWYRIEVAVPAEWTGSPVRLVARGVDDEYDVYVNGRHLAHHGEWPSRSVWGCNSETEVAGELRFGATNLIAIRVDDWGGGGGLWRRIELRRRVPIAPYAHLLPAPIVESRPDWVALYWAAWEMAWNKVSFGTADNGLVDAYMDEGFNEQIYQWDSSFLCLFGRYGLGLFPVMATLDNFYRKQRDDGYIQRVYSETTGREVEPVTADEPVVNPPLFAWVEWEYYRFSGDGSRLAAVRPGLEAYYGWLREHLRDPAADGLYFQTGLGSGMDNTPRGAAARGGWIDMSAQQALAARHLADLAEATGDPMRATEWRQEHAALAATINRLLYHQADGFYYDRTRAGALTRIKHIGAMWTLLAGVATGDAADRLIEHLADPDEFARAHLFPALAASEPDYSPRGHYWRGGVWAPTNYMTIGGLARVARDDFAAAAAENHLDTMTAVYLAPPADPNLIAPEERVGDRHTIWECYAPDAPEPATRWDGTYLGRQEFVGWSGLGPIALLYEQILGLRVIGAEGAIEWMVTRTDRHGVERMPLGDDRVDLVAEPRGDAASPIVVHVTCGRPFALVVKPRGGPPRRFEVEPGHSELVVD
jgi:hypothetical protein